MKHILLLNQINYHHYCRDDRPVLGRESGHLSIITKKRIAANIPADHYRRLLATEMWDDDHCLEVAKAWHRQEPLDRVVAVSEDHVLLAGRIRDELGLPGMSYADSLAFRDKVLMKERVARNGIPVPSFSPLAEPADAAAFVGVHGRSVIKPRLGSGSEHVYIVQTPNEAAVVASAIGAAIVGYQIETFIEGRMYHCDAVFVRGRRVLASTSRYLNSTTSFDTEPGLVSVMEGPSGLRTRIEQLNDQAARALGLTDGVGHLEVIVTPQGDIVFCEMACRPGGAGVVPAITETHGVNLLHASVLLQAGADSTFESHRVADPISESKLAAWLVFYRRAGTVTAVSRLEDFGEPWIARKSISVAAGSVLTEAEHSVDTIAQFIVTAHDHPELMQRVSTIRQRWRMEVSAALPA